MLLVIIINHKHYRWKIHPKQGGNKRQSTRLMPLLVQKMPHVGTPSHRDLATYTNKKVQSIFPVRNITTKWSDRYIQRMKTSSFTRSSTSKGHRCSETPNEGAVCVNAFNPNITQVLRRMVWYWLWPKAGLVGILCHCTNLPRHSARQIFHNQTIFSACWKPVPERNEHSYLIPLKLQPLLVQRSGTLLLYT